MAEKLTSDDVIADALERFDESQEGIDHNRDAFEEDVRFARLGDQWPEKIKETREAEGRPCLTVNKMPAFIRQVTNDARQMMPSVSVSPVDNFADEDTAEVLAGLVRSIERNSNADVAYDTAVDHSVSGGMGFWRIEIDWAHADSFDMEAYIRRIPNPMMVHWDPNSMEFDASDWMYCFVSEWHTEDAFKDKWPDADPVSWEGSDDRDSVNAWRKDGEIQVSEYWCREEAKRTLLLLANETGQTVAIRQETYEDEEQPHRVMLEMGGFTARRSREVDYFEVKRRVITAVEVLEEEDWPGELIPVVPVWGEEVIIDGRRHFRSMIRDAKDPQTMFNFWRSASTELVALAPKAPWVGPEGFIPKKPGAKQKWNTANTRSHAYLEYNADAGGAPQRQPFAGIPAGALQESLNASDDMKSVIGIYDAGLGARSNETSGVAIARRQLESDVSNLHFTDNLKRSMAYSGRVLLDIIPHVYSAQHAIRILGPDMREKVVKLTRDNPAAQGDVKGKDPLYNLQVGKYDVTVKAGPSYTTQREETRETLLSIMREVEGAAAVLGDVLMDTMDFQGADKIANRLKVLLPEAIQAAESGELDNIPDEAVGLVMQLKGQLTALQKKYQEETQGNGLEGAKLMQERQQHKDKMQVDIFKIKTDAKTKVAIEQIKANANDRPAVGVNLSEVTEAQMLEQSQNVTAAITQQNAAVLEALGQIRDALTVMAGPKTMEVVTESGRRFRGVSSATPMQ